jgi:hypothetical protein
VKHARDAVEDGVDEARRPQIEAGSRPDTAHDLRWNLCPLQVLTSMLSSETNSETQPWAALGLLGEAG